MAVPQITFARSTHYDDAVGRASAECGIDYQYWDIFGHSHEAPLSTRKQILEAMGWDTSSLEAIDNRRIHEFLRKHAEVLPKTLVVSEADRFIPLTLPAHSPYHADLEIWFEGGGNQATSFDTARLSLIGGVSQDDRYWQVFQLPLAAGIPLGYHRVQIKLNGHLAAESTVILCPDQCYLPDRLAHGGKTAGFNVALYGLRSARNWGCGDFTDLRALIDWAHGEVGFSFVGVNPLHALHNRVPYNTSPYLPLSVYYKNLIYLDIESVPEFEKSACAQNLFRSHSIQTQIRGLRQAEYVAYHEVDRLKERFLKLLYREFRQHRHWDQQRANAFASYCDREGELLHKFALYCALDEILHKQDRNRWTWRDWPEAYHSPDSPDSQEFARRYSRTVEFYKYVQFLIDGQLGTVQDHAKQRGMEIGLYHDLAVATDSCGADLWAHRPFFVNGCRVGAPPDDFSPKGQDWGFPPPSAAMHKENGYYLYRESIRKILQHGGALRIDHVMRLFRLFWIPAGMEATEGTYVWDNAQDLMRILALESVRSRNIIIGEDLGTVTDEMRDMLAQFRILSYRLFYFEKRKDGSFKRSHEYPAQALVSSTTHDLPTLAGFWLNRDVEARRAAGLADDAGYHSQIEARRREKQLMLEVLREEGLLHHDYERHAANLPELNGDLHNAAAGFMVQVPSMLLLVNQEDFTKETEQQNLPGSTAQYPNWQRKMRFSVEDLKSHALEGYNVMFRHQLARAARK